MKNVMLVDDSPTMLASISGILTRAGYAVDTSRDAEECIGKLQAGAKPAVLVTDLNMPGMNGIELIRAARKVLRFTPMLMLTTESQAERRAEAKDAGATGWLVKPVDADALLKVLAQVAP